MLFTRRSVADCFNTTPRAPRRMARTTSRSSSAAVTQITRVGSESKLTSSSTARPSLSGMRKSRSRMSGFSLVNKRMHSAPFEASPTMVTSSSASNNFRRPSRKIAWSSAIRMRIGCLFLAILTERYLYGQPRPMPRTRLNCQQATHCARVFLYGNRAEPQTVQFIAGKPPREAKPFAVVIHDQDNRAFRLRQFYHDVGSSGMLFYIVECFPVYLEQFPADSVRSL